MPPTPLSPESFLAWPLSSRDSNSGNTELLATDHPHSTVSTFYIYIIYFTVHMHTDKGANPQPQGAHSPHPSSRRSDGK